MLGVDLSNKVCNNERVDNKQESENRMENLNKYYNNLPGDEFVLLGKEYTVKNVLGFDKLEMTNGQIYKVTFSGSLVRA